MQLGLFHKGDVALEHNHPFTFISIPLQIISKRHWNSIICMYSQDLSYAGADPEIEEGEGIE